MNQLACSLAIIIIKPIKIHSNNVHEFSIRPLLTLLLAQPLYQLFSKEWAQTQTRSAVSTVQCHLKKL